MTDQPHDSNHTDEPHVRFGPKDHQVLTLEVASMVLTMWRERQPAAFGAYLAEALTGAQPRGQRGGPRP